MTDLENEVIELRAQRRSQSLQAVVTTLKTARTVVLCIG